MATGSSVIGGPDEISKGLFGYRKTDVEQLLSDRDHMLRQAETRIRTAEGRIGELETALDHSESRNAVVQEQLLQLQEHVLQLQQQLEGLAARNAQVEQYAGRVRAEAQRMASWREQVQGIVGSMKPTVDRLLLLVDSTPIRVEEALSPVAAKMPTLVSLMRDFAQVSRPEAGAGPSRR
jgi:cell division septum initiation protein DivIVA